MNTYNKILPIFIMWLLAFNFSLAQVNYIQNPSFENIISCPTTYSEIYLANYWDTLRTRGGCGPDLLSSCADPNIQIGVPWNEFGESYQFPRTGNNYCLLGMFVTPSGYREYIQNQLKDTLKQGKTYCTTFYVSLGNRSEYAIDNIGAYFDNGTITASGTCQPIIVNTQIQSSSGVYLTDTLHWVKIENSFIANGTETYISIGNFKNNATTNTIIINSISGSSIAEYYIDDVSVIPIDLTAYAGNDTIITNGDSIYIGRINEIGLDDDCIWYINSIAIDTTAGMWVKPTTITTYVVEQNICGTITRDTITVDVGTVGIKKYIDKLGISVYPNPASDKIFIEEIKNEEITDVILTDLYGKEVFKTSKHNEISISGLTAGIYFIQVNTKNSTSTQKIIVQH